MKLRILSLASLLLATAASYAQGAFSFKINEVYIASPCDSTGGYLDEYGEKHSWIEISNTSWGTRDIRSYYLTNNRNVLNKDLDVPERVDMMSLIHKGDPRTVVGARQQITFFADGMTNRGTLHTNFKLEPGKDNFIALYDGNGKTLLDSITVPASLKPGYSYARVYNADNDSYEWVMTDPQQITPNGPNKIDGKTEDKIAEFKQNDPYGVAMAIIAMAIVFVCLTLLYVFFRFFGWAITRTAKLERVKAIRKIHEQASKVTVMAKQGTETQGIEYDNYVAAISLALHEYMGNTHDIESGVITIKRHDSAWNSKSRMMRTVPGTR